MKDTSLWADLDANFNYRCLNWDCSNKKIIKVTKKRRDESRDEFCPECGNKLKLIGEEYNCIATFGSKTSEEKKAILKKRASEHNRTKMKDRVAEIKKRIIKNNSGK